MIADLILTCTLLAAYVAGGVAVIATVVAALYRMGVLRDR